MSAGKISGTHPTSATTDVVNLGQVVTPQMLADICTTLNGIVKLTTANSSDGANKVTSLRSLVIDGTGAVATADPGAGKLVVSGTISGSNISPNTITGTSTPTPTPTPGVIYSDAVLFARGYVLAAGGINRGMNISSVTHSGGSGIYTVNFVTAAATNTYQCVANPVGGSAAFAQVAVQNTGSVIIRTFNQAGTLTDSDFNFLIVGI